MIKDRILVIGANGQIGTVLVKQLREIYGQENVVASDIKFPSDGNYRPFEILDATDIAKMEFVVSKYRITQIYHLAAILSAKGELNPLHTWDVNMKCLFNVLEIAQQQNVKKVFFPSTIAVFGRNTPKINTPQDTLRTPETVYGMSKVAGENWCTYYFSRYSLDIRSVRYPGIIGYQSKAGGGTTDYAVEIFDKAVDNEPYTCFLSKNTRLPMMYMEDAIRATIELMECEASKITIRSSYNLAGMSFTPEELHHEIIKHIPNFKVDFQPDFRQAIAETWPESIDDTKARNDWGWKPRYDIELLTADMILNIKESKKKIATEIDTINFKD
jgi:threonine 3-dehydrogenase